MSFLEELHKIKRTDEFKKKELEQHKKILKLRKEQKFKELEPMIRDALDALGMATWKTERGKRNYEIFCNRENFQFRLCSGPYEYVFKVIFEDDGEQYFEAGVMGNMAKSIDTSKKSLEQVIKTIYKRGPDFLGETYDSHNRKKRK